jgi:bacteriorhodopsin
MKIFRYALSFSAVVAFGLLLVSTFKVMHNQAVEPLASLFGIFLGASILLWSLYYGSGRFSIYTRGGKEISPIKEPIFYWFIILSFGTLGLIVIIFSFLSIK